MNDLSASDFLRVPRADRPPVFRVPVLGDWVWLVGAFAYTSHRRFGVALLVLIVSSLVVAKALGGEVGGFVIGGNVCMGVAFYYYLPYRFSRAARDFPPLSRRP